MAVHAGFVQHSGCSWDNMFSGRIYSEGGSKFSSIQTS